MKIINKNINLKIVLILFSLSFLLGYTAFHKFFATNKGISEPIKQTSVSKKQLLSNNKVSTDKKNNDANNSNNTKIKDSDSLQMKTLAKYKINAETNFTALLEKIINSDTEYALKKHEQDEVFALWSQNDPQEAILWLQGVGNFLFEDNTRKSNLLHTALLEYSKKDLPATELLVSEFDEGLQESFILTYIRSNAVSTGIIEDDIVAINSLFSNERLKSKAVRTLIDEYVILKPDQALKGLSQITDNENPVRHDLQVYQAAFFLSENSESAISEAEISNYPKPLQESITQGVTSNLVYKNPEEAYNWVMGMQQGEIKDHAIKEFLKADIDIDYSTSLEMSSHIENENQQLAAILRSVSENRKANPDTLKEFLTNSAGLSSRNKEMIEKLTITTDR